MRRTVPPILAASLLALTACGDSGSPSLPSQRFDSVTELKDAVVERGVACESDRITSGDEFKESLRCGDNVWLTVFEGSADKHARIETYEQRKSTFMEGRNWVVVAPQETLDKLSR